MNNQAQAQGNNVAGLTADQVRRLNQRFRSKRDLYDYFDRVMQIYLPREKSCSIQFMQAIMNARKRFLWKHEHRNLKLPLWPELSVARIWPQAVQLPRFLEHIPDDWTLQ